jgi:hypothetical protein
VTGPPHPSTPNVRPWEKRESTEASRHRLALAQALTDTCPPKLGEEIAITGSVARGIADRYSDIEINCWVRALPEPEAWREWLRAAGATHIPEKAKAPHPLRCTVPVGTQRVPASDLPAEPGASPSPLRGRGVTMPSTIWMSPLSPTHEKGCGSGSGNGGQRPM